MNKDTILERQTDFTREDLIALIKDGGGGRQPCLFVNELVVLFWQGDAGAGKFLCSLLQDLQMSADEQYPVYAGLSSVPNPDKEILQALEEFRSKLENQKLMTFAEPVIQKTREILAQVL